MRLPLVLCVLPFLACATTSSPSSGSSSSTSTSSSGAPDAGPSLVCAAVGGLDVHQPLDGTVTVPVDLGRVLGCVEGRSWTSAQLRADQVVAAEHISPVGGAREIEFQYISQGPVGTPRRVTGLLMIPEGEGPFPLVAVDHGTSGMGPGCGPTLNHVYIDYLALPLVASGYAVVATDYQNLGVAEGTHPYAVGRAAADNTLDAIRAAQRLNQEALGGTLFTDELFIMGHSQGGHAALFAHQFYSTSGITGFRLLGDIPFAPAFGIPYGAGANIANGAQASNAVTVFTVMMLLGHGAYFGIPVTDWLTTDAANRLPDLAQTQCYSDFASSVTSNWRTHAALFTPEFRAAAGTCAFDGNPCPGFSPWAEDVYASTPGYFTSDVPVLMLLGGRDVEVGALSVACIQAALRRNNTPVRTCFYSSADHITVTINGMADVLGWMQGRRDGQDPDVCPAALTTTCPGF